MVNFFLDHGARINSRNDQGRTPLIEAALWGRAGNSIIPLATGAGQELKDRKGCKTIDFTTRSEEHMEKRHSHVGGVYIEGTFYVDKQRKAIRGMLDSQHLTSTAPLDLSKPKTLRYDCHSFHRLSITSKAVLSAPVARFPVPRSTKTIAWLERERPLPSGDAMSVQKNVIFNSKIDQLDGSILSCQVRDRLLDFESLS